MSFGSENPELYGEICKRGIVNKLRAEMKKNGFDDIDELTIEAIVDIIYESPKAFNVFLDWANDEVCAAEAGYWGDRIDEAVVRHEIAKENKMPLVWTRGGDIKEEQPG